MTVFLFYLCSVIAVLSAAGVILHPQPTRALLSLIVTMFALAVLYLLLGAPFLAMVNLIVYAGAVLVLFLFVIMLLGVGAKDAPLKERFPLIHILFSLVIGGAFIAALAFLLRGGKQTLTAFEGTVELIGRRLFTQYLLPFELIALLLLVGIFAAISLAKKDEGDL